MEKLHKASLSLDELKSECHYIQNKFEVKLVHLQGAEVEVTVNSQNHFNKAVYAAVGGDLSKIPALVFIEINQSGDVVTAYSDMAAVNGYFIFDEMLYIGGNEQRVFGYGHFNS